MPTEPKDKEQTTPADSATTDEGKATPSPKDTDTGAGQPAKTDGASGNDDGSKTDDNGSVDLEPKPGQVIIEGKDGKKSVYDAERIKEQQRELTRAQQEISEFKKSEATGKKQESRMNSLLESLKHINVTELEQGTTAFDIVHSVFSMEDDVIQKLPSTVQREVYRIKDEVEAEVKDQAVEQEKTLDTYRTTIKTEAAEMRDNPELYPLFNETELAEFMRDRQLHRQRVTPKQAYWMLYGDNLQSAHNKAVEDLEKTLEERVAKLVEEGILKYTKDVVDGNKTVLLPPSDSAGANTDQQNEEAKKGMSALDRLTQGFRKKKGQLIEA